MRSVPAIRTAPVQSSNLSAIISLETLRLAWRKVRSNGGGPGGDGVTIEGFEQDAETQLSKLAARLAGGRYRPGPLRRHRIPKPKGGYRELAVPCIIDRVAQTAVLLTLVPVLDRRLAEESFAYRPGRSVEQALLLARRYISGGLAWIVDADIASFFDSVPHRRLIEELAIWLDDTRLLSLIGLWLRTWAFGAKGLPQGAPLSPLLANLYLHPVDRLLTASGIAAVRYADDFVMLCRSDSAAQRAKRIAAGALSSRGLTLHPEKTRIIPAAEGTVFLGEPLP